MVARALRFGTLTAVALLVGACGDDLPTGSNSGDELEAAEVEALVVELFDLIETIDVDIPGLHVTDPRLFLSRAAVPIDETFDQTDQCDGGGTASVAGTANGDVDDETGEGDVTIDATVTFDDCEVEGETVTYTLQGDPEIGLVADFTITEESVALSIDVSGGFAFTTDDDRAGTCAVDLSVSITVTGVSFSETVSGSVCGVNASGFDTELFDEDV